jgi:hypothetical protein
VVECLVRVARMAPKVVHWSSKAPQQVRTLRSSSR